MALAWASTADSSPTTSESCCRSSSSSSACRSVQCQVPLALSASSWSGHGARARRGRCGSWPRSLRTRYGRYSWRWSRWNRLPSRCSGSRARASRAFTEGKTAPMARTRDLWQNPARRGHGKRWLAVWAGPGSREQTKAFAKKSDADRHGTAMTADQLRGAYVDPRRHAGARLRRAEVPAVGGAPAAELREHLHVAPADTLVATARRPADPLTVPVRHEGRRRRARCRPGPVHG